MTSERTKAMDNLIAQDADLIDKLRDEDSYYRLQEKHWCIDAEELERQRLAAAALIETQAREIERLRQTGTFLLARLDDLEWLDDQLEETARQYFGHVDPAIYHFRAALAGDSHD